MPYCIYIKVTFQWCIYVHTNFRALTSCNVTFEVVRVHKDNILGNVGEGFKIAMKQLDQARIGIAAQALGNSNETLNSN